MTRVLIADDHGVLRDGLGRVIAAQVDLELVGVAANGAEAVELCRRTSPDVVLMDLEMPVMDGIEATRAIVHANPATAVLVLTSFADRRRITGALDAGALGYLLKDASADDVVEGIRAAALGRLPARSAGSTPAARVAGGAGPACGSLSPRAGSARSPPRRDAQQADCPSARDQRKDREVAPDERIPGNRCHRPRASSPLGGAAGTPWQSRSASRCSS